MGGGGGAEGLNTAHHTNTHSCARSFFFIFFFLSFFQSFFFILKSYPEWSTIPASPNFQCYVQEGNVLCT